MHLGGDHIAQLKEKPTLFFVDEWLSELLKNRNQNPTSYCYKNSLEAPSSGYKKE